MATTTSRLTLLLPSKLSYRVSFPTRRLPCNPHAPLPLCLRVTAAATTSRTLASPASSESPEAKELRLETEAALEWGGVCARLADVAATAAGRGACGEGRVPVGRSRGESERMLEQTAAAALLSAPLDFGGVDDVSAVVAAAARGRLLAVREIRGVGRSLRAARGVFDQVKRLTEEMPDGRYSPLLDILQDCDFLIELVQRIEFCLDSNLSMVLDRASKKLETIRKERRGNIDMLESLLRDTSISNVLPAPTPAFLLPTAFCGSVLPLTPAARRPARLLSVARRAPVAASLGVSHDTGANMPGTDIIGQNDLLIVGPGVLGRLVAEKWQKEHPGCKVFGQTASTDHHSELNNIGIIPFLKGSTIPKKAPYVIFCAPPSRSDDYPGDLRVAASNWSGEGSFLFTSSTALYDCSDNRLCNEDCPSIPIGRGPRTDVLLKAENVVIEAGGCVLRLAGLYKIDRGAHTFWLRKGTLDIRPDHIINQIHYEDAASLAVAIMKNRPRARVFLGCDNMPLSRQEIMESVNKSGKFDMTFQGFTGTDGPLGKRMENSKTRAYIGWEPKYPSFKEFLGVNK